MAKFVYKEIVPIDNILVYPDKDNLPSKLCHLKNNTFLLNSYFPLTGKHVKKLWAYKKTKMDRVKRDLVWEYFRHRKRKPVTQVVRDMFYRNRKRVTFVYFDDPIQRHIELTKEHVDMLKHIGKIRKDRNCLNPFNNKQVKKLWNKKKMKDTFKKRGVWNLQIDGESISITEILIKMYNFNTSYVFFTYTDGSEDELDITPELYEQLKSIKLDNIAYKPKTKDLKESQESK